MLLPLSKREIPLIVISDMYFGGKDIARLLAAHKLDRYFDCIHVSADEKVCKGTGRLFEVILNKYGCEPHQMLHIGDNVISDYQIPHSAGIHVIQLKEHSEYKRRFLLSRYKSLADVNPYWRGRYFLQVAHGNNHVDLNAGFDYRYGWEILGPIFCTFTLSLLERLEKICPDKIYFMARDGYLLQKLYLKLAPALGFEIFPDDYLYISRHVTFAASVSDGLKYEQAVVGLYNPMQKGLLSILKVFALDPEEFKDIAERHGFRDISEPLNDWEDSRLLSFLSDKLVQEKIKKRGSNARHLMESYLDQNGFFNAKRIVMVDIGWNGTTQYGLEQLPRWKNSNNEMWGLFFGFCGVIPYEFGERNHLEGLWYDHTRCNDSERVTLEYEEIFEESTRAAHATTIGYKKNNSIIEPLLKSDDKLDRRQELASNARIAELQRGIMDFADSFIGAVHLTGYKAKDIHPFMLTLLERAVAFPQRDEVDKLTKISHSEDFGHDNIMDFSSLNDRRVSLFYLRRFIRELRASHWRYAMLSGPLRVLFRLYQLIRKK